LSTTTNERYKRNAIAFLADVRKHLVSAMSVIESFMSIRPPTTPELQEAERFLVALCEVNQQLQENYTRLKTMGFVASRWGQCEPQSPSSQEKQGNNLLAGWRMEGNAMLARDRTPAITRAAIRLRAGLALRARQAI
jgi:hypothetical protein